jgi:hypothetical protein
MALTSVTFHPHFYKIVANQSDSANDNDISAFEIFQLHWSGIFVASSIRRGAIENHRVGILYKNSRAQGVFG